MEVKPGWYRMRNGEIANVLDVRKDIVDNPYCALGWCKGLSESWMVNGRYRQGRSDSPQDLIEPLPSCTGFDWTPIPPEQNYVPWDYESCPVGSQLKDKHSPPSRFLITGADIERLFINGRPWSYKTAFDTWTQLDGKPAGKVQS